MPTGRPWNVWFLCAGRGFGKTRTGAETVRHVVENEGIKRIALVAPTAADARDVMVEGESGLMAVCPPWNKPIYEPSKRRVVWPNGALATLYSADEPERLRGPQHEFAWCDELGSWRYDRDAWDMLMLGLRLGKNPRAVITSTPKSTRLIREIVGDKANTAVTTGSTYDNKNNLAGTFLAKIKDKYEGTRLGRQEIYAEILTENAGALWTRKMVEDAMLPRNTGLPLFKRIVVAVDPAVTESESADETGIVVCGLGEDGLGYLLKDASGRMSPSAWAGVSVSLYHSFMADRIVAETNNGGAMVELTIRTVDKDVSYRGLHASRGKRARAEPIAALYEQGKIRHLESSGELEDQLCTWEPLGTHASPDRLDALVWAFSELFQIWSDGLIAVPHVSSQPSSIPGGATALPFERAWEPPP